MNKIKISAKISGISACVPKNKFLNINYRYQEKQKLIKFIKATGIKERKIVKNSKVCTSDLAVEAVKKLIKDLSWSSNEIEFLIMVTQTPDYLTPSTTCTIQDRLKLKNSIYNIDINYGCSGFPYGVSNAFSLMETLRFKKGILIIGDVSSRFCNIRDKSTWPLFGDGCAAIAFENQNYKQDVFFDFYTDGSGYRDIFVPSHSLAGRNQANKKDFIVRKQKDDNIKSNFNLSLNGANIYSFSITKVPERIDDFIKFSKIKKKNIKYCFLHQANKLINENIREKLNLKNTIFPGSLEKFGNTSSATIPISIVNNFGGKEINGLSMIAGFGVGLSMSSSIYNFQRCKVSKFVYL